MGAFILLLLLLFSADNTKTNNIYFLKGKSFLMFFILFQSVIVEVSIFFYMFLWVIYWDAFFSFDSM